MQNAAGTHIDGEGAAMEHSIQSKVNGQVLDSIGGLFVDAMYTRPWWHRVSGRLKQKTETEN